MSSQVLLALKGLTSVFGMGTGGTPSSLPPEMVWVSASEAASLHFPLHVAALALSFERTLTTAQASEIHRLTFFVCSVSLIRVLAIRASLVPLPLRSLRAVIKPSTD